MADLLDETLEEEKAANDKLTDVAADILEDASRRKTRGGKRKPWERAVPRKARRPRSGPETVPAELDNYFPITAP